MSVTHSHQNSLSRSERCFSCKFQSSVGNRRIRDRENSERSLWGGNLWHWQCQKLGGVSGGKKINDPRQYIFHSHYTPKVKYVICSCSCSVTCKMCLDLACKHCRGAHERCMEPLERYKEFRDIKDIWQINQDANLTGCHWEFSNENGLNNWRGRGNISSMRGALENVLPSFF